MNRKCIYCIRRLRSLPKKIGRSFILLHYHLTMFLTLTSSVSLAVYPKCINFAVRTTARSFSARTSVVVSVLTTTCQ